MSKKRKTSGNEITYNVSSVTTDPKDEPVKKRKVNKGKTGVELRYYKPAEYCKLNSSQIEELHQWRKESGLVKAKDNKMNNKKGSMQEQVIAAMKEISKQADEKEKDEEIFQQFISAVNAERNSTNTVQSIRAVGSREGSTKSEQAGIGESTISAIVKRLK